MKDSVKKQGWYRDMETPNEDDPICIRRRLLGGDSEPVAWVPECDDAEEIATTIALLPELMETAQRLLLVHDANDVRVGAKEANDLRAVLAKIAKVKGE